MSISTPPGWDANPLQVTPPQFVRFSQQFAGTHLYSWMERGTVRVKCLAQEHNTVSPAWARTQTAESIDEHTNNEATVPPHMVYSTTKNSLQTISSYGKGGRNGEREEESAHII